MARFDVYPNPDGQGYLLDVQTDLLDDLNTRVVVPLIIVGNAPNPAKRLNPVFEIRREPHVMLTQFMAAIPASLLKEPIANLSENAAEVTNALDMVFFGF